MDSSFYLVQKLKELPYCNKGFLSYLITPTSPETYVKKPGALPDYGGTKTLEDSSNDSYGVLTVGPRCVSSGHIDLKIIAKL